MAVVVNKAEAFQPTTQPYTRVSGTWRGGKKVYTKAAGVWKEGWPQLPNSPQSPAIASRFDGSNIVIDSSWSAPDVGGFPYDRFITQLVFRDPSGANEYPQGGIGYGSSTFAYTSLGQGNNNGWQHLAGWSVKLQVWAGHNAISGLIYEYWSPVAESGYVPVIQLPVPPVPTGLTTSMASCALTTSWTHAGSAALTGFEIQVWQNGYTPTSYTVGPTVRSYAGQPWDPNTVGRHGVNVQVRAMGTGGNSAWVTTSGVMPGPLSVTSPHYNTGVFYVLLSGAYEGFHVWRDYWGSPTWTFQNTEVANGGGQFWYADSASSGYARDNSTQRRLIFQPYNAANGWTGRLQGSGYVVKIPNPVYIAPADCNTWWSIPIPGKWRTNPQADNWFYQGKSISGNSYGTLFFQNRVSDYFSVARIGYDVGITSWDVYTKRTNTGGLASAVALNVWTHNRQDDSADAAPGLVNGPSAGPSLLRDQKAWVPLSTSWWANMKSGAAKGITYYVDPSAADNQLRSEIGNVSNRYMILDKPTYGTTLDGQVPGTLRIYHGG